MKIHLVSLAIASLALTGCLRVKVDPVEVKPITLNVNLKIDRELDEFFSFEEELAPAPARKAPLSVPPEADAPARPTTQMVPVREY